ncbi:sulfotransferase 1C4-like [Styela clava]
MHVFIILSIALSTAFLYARTRWKSMRMIDRDSFKVKLMIKLGIPHLLRMTGLSEILRVRYLYHFRACNGYETLLSNTGMAAVYAEALKFQIRDDDVFIATYPKSGTTWRQQIVWLICNNADINVAKDKPLSSRIPFLETIDMTDNVSLGIQTLEKWQKNKPRIIKTHLAYGLLPEDIQSGNKCKIIYVARNAKDVCVSYYFFHVMNMLLPHPGTWSEFLKNYSSGNILFGSWFPHVLTYWEKFQTDKERIYFTTYEAMKKDMKKEIVAVANFLGKKLTNEQIDIIFNFCTFDSTSKNKSTNYSKKCQKFMRKGEVGDWKNYFTINENAAFDELYNEKIKDSGLDIPFEM